MAYTNSKLHVVAVGGKQVNADWDETNPLSPAYIRNKPNITGGLHYEIVDELPTEDIDPTAIYMVLREDPETGNHYDEYMYIDGEWEMIGSTATQNVQADWTESDPSNPAYINNKPTIGNGALRIYYGKQASGNMVGTTTMNSTAENNVVVAPFIVPKTATTDTLDVVCGTSYRYSNPMTALTINSYDDSAAPSDIYFTTNSNGCTLTLPNTFTKVVGSTTLEADKMYHIHIADKVCTIENLDEVEENNWYGTMEEYLVLKATNQLVEGTNYYIEGTPGDSLAKVATTGSYNDLGDKPDIGNGTITLKKPDGTTMGSFSTNQGNDDDITIAATNDWFGTQQEFDALQTYDPDCNYYIEGEIEAPVQSDWNENDNTSLAYIKNKPTNLVFGNLLGSPASFTLRTISAADYANLGTYDNNTIYLVY